MTQRITQSKWDAQRAEAKANARAKSEDAVEAPEDSSEAEGYDGWSDDELAEEAQERGLTTEAGNRLGVIAALELDDQANPE